MDSASPVDTGMPATIDTMPTVYKTDIPQSGSTSYTQPDTSSSSSSDVVDVAFIKGPHGLLKAGEMVLSIVTFICATVDGQFVKSHGGGWVQFVSMTSLLCTAILYTFHAFKLPPKFPDGMNFKFAEFIYYDVVDLCYFISGIVSAVWANNSSAVVAAAIFSFFSLGVYCVNTYFRFMAWRHSGEGPYFSSIRSSTNSGSGSDRVTQY